MMPLSTCINVDLPAPLWPTTPSVSPGSITRSTPASACTAPNCLAMPSSATSGASDFTHRATPFDAHHHISPALATGEAGNGLPAALASIMSTVQAKSYGDTATDPSGITASHFSMSSFWITGSGRFNVFGIALPAKSCCATQNAAPEQPGVEEIEKVL